MPPISHFLQVSAQMPSDQKSFLTTRCETVSTAPVPVRPTALVPFTERMTIQLNGLFFGCLTPPGRIQALRGQESF